MRTSTRPAIAVRPRPVATLLLAGAVLATVLSGCSPTVALQPAEHAIDAACAQVVVGLPETVAGQQQRKTDAQGTGAWGDPASVLLRCGVPVPPPTAEYACYTIDGVDWLRNEDEAPNYIFTTYGRDPAVEVIVDGDAVSGADALRDLAFAVSVTPKQGECIAPEDVFD